MVDGGPVTGTASHAQVPTALRTNAGTVFSAKRLHIGSHFRILPDRLSSVDRVFHRDTEIVGVVGRWQANTGDGIGLLLEHLFEFEVLRIGKRGQAPAARGIDENVAFEAHEDAVRHANEFDMAAVNGFLWIEDVRAGGTDWLPEKMRNVKQHGGDTSRLEVYP